MRRAIVIPNHLPHLNFLKEWEELKDEQIIVVQDIGDTCEVPEGFTNVTIYNHKDIEKDLGKNAWIIPDHTSACRSYGYYKAWQTDAEIIITIDTDCYPERPDYWLRIHENRLQQIATLDWEMTHESVFARGFPYEIRGKAPVVLNHGLWSNIPDLDAPTALHNPNLRFAPAMQSKVIPKYNFFPMCGMNLAWKRDLTPAMWFGLFGGKYGFDQYDDIWAGVLVKKVMDHLDLAASSGVPSVEHRKQSNVYVNLKKQAPGMAMNENFWKAVRNINISKKSNTITSAYRELIERLPNVIKDEPEGYTRKFKEAALIWIGLFE